MKLLVTGGSGFIGSHFVRHMLRDRDDVEDLVNLDLLTYAGDRDNLEDLEADPRYRFLHGDIRDAGTVEQAARGVDWIVNFAAETHVDRSIQEAGGFVQTDVFGTYVLLEACRREEASFLQVSTDEVYGTAPPGESFDESAPLRPRNPYAASKAGGEMLAASYGTTHRLPVIVTRCTNNVGPNQHIEKMVPLFATNAILGLPLPIYGDGRQMRDWIWVEDHVRALSMLLDKGRAGEAYNIGTGGEHENLETAQKILSTLGASEDLLTRVADRPGHDRRYSLNTEKMRALGWEPRVDFDDAIRKAVLWYRDHPRWWEKRRRSPDFQQHFRKVYGESGPA